MTKREQLIKQENHRLKQEIERLRQQNLKLTIENEFVKKLSVLVDQRTKHRYGYRRITVELRRRGLLANHKKSAALNEQVEIVWHSQQTLAQI